MKKVKCYSKILKIFQKIKNEHKFMLHTISPHRKGGHFQKQGFGIRESPPTWGYVGHKNDHIRKWYIII